MNDFPLLPHFVRSGMKLGLHCGAGAGAIYGFLVIPNLCGALPGVLIGGFVGVAAGAANGVVLAIVTALTVDRMDRILYRWTMIFTALLTTFILAVLLELNEMQLYFSDQGAGSIWLFVAVFFAAIYGGYQLAQDYPLYRRRDDAPLLMTSKPVARNRLLLVLDLTGYSMQLGVMFGLLPGAVLVFLTSSLHGLCAPLYLILPGLVFGTFQGVALGIVTALLPSHIEATRYRLTMLLTSVMLSVLLVEFVILASAGTVLIDIALSTVLITCGIVAVLAYASQLTANWHLDNRNQPSSD